MCFSIEKKGIDNQYQWHLRISAVGSIDKQENVS